MQNRRQGLITWWGDFVLGKIVGTAGMAMFLGGTGLAIIEVVRRYVFGVSWIWQQDIVIVALLSGMFLYFCNTQWARGHITLTLVSEPLTRKGANGQKGAWGLSVTAGLLTVGYVIVLVYWGLPLVPFYSELGIKVPSQAVYFWPFFLIFIISLFPLAVTFLITTYRDSKGGSLGDGDTAKH